MESSQPQGNKLIVFNTYATPASGKTTLGEFIRDKLKTHPHIQLHTIDDDKQGLEIAKRFTEQGVSIVEMLQDNEVIVDELVACRLARLREILQSLQQGWHFIFIDDPSTFLRSDYETYHLVQNEDLLPGFDRAYFTLFQQSAQDSLVAGFPFSRLQILNVVSRAYKRSAKFVELVPVTDLMIAIFKCLRAHRGASDQISRFRSEMKDTRHQFLPFNFFQQVEVPQDEEVQEALRLVDDLFVKAVNSLSAEREVPLVTGRKEAEDFLAHIHKMIQSTSPSIQSLFTFPTSADYEHLWTAHLEPALKH